ncbi:7-dehydrocholesterol reductase-like protein [Dinothrombium tinctorium]|uniref:7-dehydrocholesterol reductase n=1 Tax=Dinothrombium tinctorium TaxID=1965070 RepID=A0A3S3PC90_9ACAR|nr:7-dehydrocholesterol reductase-like protein [Dinothrombium tinctorium]RWS12320.1 7-dehydrocholesterol reductase-like protein [Dinothrombium tinctorium]
MKLYDTLSTSPLIMLILIIVCPYLDLVLLYVVIKRNSDLNEILKKENLFELFKNALKEVQWQKIEYLLIIMLLLLWSGFSCVGLGGDTFFGPQLPNGAKAKYLRSGFRFYMLSLLLFVPLMAYFKVLNFYNNFVTFAAYLNLFGIFLSIFLFIKGKYFPSNGYNRSSGNFIIDFFCGIELNPRIGEHLDLKQMMICRFLMIIWQLILMMAWKANYELTNESGEPNWAITANVLIQSMFIAKFLYNEDLYMATFDVVSEHFGFYSAWGFLLLPTFYPLPILYLVKHSPIAGFGFIKFITVVAMGATMILLRFMNDNQRYMTRQTNGKFNIWGKPAKVINAVYTDENNKKVQTVLLASGFWGWARHLNYTFEFGVFLCWSLPASFESPIPYFPLFILLALLIHRVFRDENKCRIKYGEYWEEYCQLVPYRLIPYVY